MSIAISPTPGYNHYMQSLTVGPTGTLHLVFQFHFAETLALRDELQAEHGYATQPRVGAAGGISTPASC